jgi:hypothetical protein
MEDINLFSHHVKLHSAQKSSRLLVMTRKQFCGLKARLITHKLTILYFTAEKVLVSQPARKRWMQPLKSARYLFASASVFLACYSLPGQSISLSVSNQVENSSMIYKVGMIMDVVEDKAKLDLQNETSMPIGQPNVFSFRSTKTITLRFAFGTMA